MRKIMIADDEELVRADLKLVLESLADYVVVGEACNGREAIEMAQKYLPDIVFMDIKMPGINGLEAAQKIKQLNLDTVIIILSAYDDFEFARQAIKAGASEYLLKPAQPNEISKVLDLVGYGRQGRQNCNQCLEDELQFDFVTRQFLLEKERMLTQSLHMKDMLLFTSTLDEYLKQLLKDCRSLSVQKAYLLKLNVILFETLIDCGNFSDEILKTDMQNVNDIVRIRSLNEVKSFFNSLKSQINSFIVHNGESDKDLINALIQYIQVNFNKDISLEKLAHSFHFSPSHLTRILKKETGSAYSEYVNQIRIAEAKVFLRNSALDINKIAGLVGYNEVSHFNRVFRRIVGTNPSAYRNLFSGNKHP